MKSGFIWKIMFATGVVPLVSPFAAFAYQMMISESWTLPEWLLLYSLIYWPTYVVGLVLMAISAFKLSRMRREKVVSA